MTGDGRRCEPLRVSDAWSRYLLKCVGLREGTGTQMVKPHFELLFREQWAAGGDPHGQRASLCKHGPGWADEAVSMVAQIGPEAGEDRARLPTAKWAARADASLA
jgi:hypothetical protein